MDEILSAVHVAEILESIPSSKEGAIPLVDLCRIAGASDAWCKGCCTPLITLLQAFDAITIVNSNDSNAPNVKASSSSASYFLKSLAAYLREGRKIVSNWERPGISEGPYSAHEILSGPQFLYFLEHRRTTGRKDAIAIRKTDVVKAIIKARVRGTRDIVYLVQFDPYSRQYQLIGGHKRNTDEDVETALRRELEEELYKDAIRFPPNYEMHHLAKLSAKELSLTYGVYTAYELHYAQIVFGLPQLTLGPNDRWVTLKELISGRTQNGVGINESAIGELDKRLPGGLNGLGLSLDQIQHRTIRQIIADHPWEAPGIILTIIGIIVSVLFFFLAR